MQLQLILSGTAPEQGFSDAEQMQKEALLLAKYKDNATGDKQLSGVETFAREQGTL